MNKPGLAFGLNLTKKGDGSTKPAIARGRAMFGGDDSDDGAGDDSKKATEASSKKGPKRPSGPPKEPPKPKSRLGTNTAMFGDLSSSLTSRKNAEAAAQVDTTIYEYDNVYDSFKPKKETKQEDIERRPKYMKSLLNAAEVRKRDALIAEEKKVAREREAEGDEYEGTEQFVTAAYKKQQEENRRVEEEEKKREDEESKKNEGGGMSTFYKRLLEKDAERHAAVVRAAEEMAKNGPNPESEPAEEADADRLASSKAKELNDKGASVDVNDDGQVVDKRQLLKGGLNVSAKKKAHVAQEAYKPAERERRDNYSSGQRGRRDAMRDRQTRMMEEQLEQSLKRTMEEESAQREEFERAAKSRKTEGEISSAKERYLARKRAAEEAKKQAGAS